MSATSDLERQVRLVLDEGAPSAPPDGLLARVLSDTGRRRPRPAWLADLKEPPMRHSTRVTVGSPTLRLAAILALTMALALAAAGAVVAGASLMPSPSVPVPPPFGPAANGSLLYAQDGDIYLADADGSNPRPIITGDENDVGPWFSQDGRTIAFARGTEPDFALMVADTDGGRVRQVLPPGEWNVEFMPSGDQMVATRRVEERTALSIIDLSSGTVRDLDVGELEPWFWQVARPIDGEEIVFRAHTTRGGWQRGLYGIRPDGTGLRTIGAVTTGDSAYDADPVSQRSLQDPVVSPDGSTVVFWDWRPQNASMTTSRGYPRLRDLTTGEDLPVGFSGPVDGGLLPRISPDGRQVLFEAGIDAADTMQLVLAPLDGSGPSVPFGPTFASPVGQGFDFSPDGAHVILGLEDEVLLVDPGSGTATNLPIPTYPSWQRLAP